MFVTTATVAAASGLSGLSGASGLSVYPLHPFGAAPGPPGTFSAAPTAPLKAPSGPSAGAGHPSSPPAPPTPPTPPATQAPGQHDGGTRRLALFGNTSWALLELMKGGLFRIQSTLPADSTVHRIEIEPSTGDVIIVLESEEFAPVRPGDRIPQILSPLVTRETPTATAHPGATPGPPGTFSAAPTAPLKAPSRPSVGAGPTGATPGPPGTFSPSATAPLKAPYRPSVGATPARAATGWALTVAYDPIKAHSSEVMARLNALPAVVRERYTFESRHDAVWAEVLLSDLPVSTHVAPDCGGAQPLA